jgi:hypothetical protein
LTSVTLGATPPVVESTIFGNTYGTSSRITIHVPSGKVGDYTRDWGVDADTNARGNVDKYGENHNAVTITDQ